MYMGAVEGNWEWSLGGKEAERLKNIEKMVGGWLDVLLLASISKTYIDRIGGWH